MRIRYCVEYSTKQMCSVPKQLERSILYTRSEVIGELVTFLNQRFHDEITELRREPTKTRAD